MPSVSATTKVLLHHRLWPLLWWTASFGGNVQAIDASAIGHAISSDLATLFELVWFLVLPDDRETADNLIGAVETPERLCVGIDAARDAEMLAVIQAVAEVCRKQEYSIDPSLPATLAKHLAQAACTTVASNAGRSPAEVLTNVVPGSWQYGRPTKDVCRSR